MKTFQQHVEAQQWKRFQRQRQFPWTRQPDNPFYRKPSFEEEYETEGYYHVTPFLNRIISSEGLKSRKQIEYEQAKAWAIRKAEIEASDEYKGIEDPTKRWKYMEKFRKQNSASMGLGSGSHPHSARLISMTYNYSRALNLYGEFRFVARIVRNRVKASEIYDRMESMTNTSYADTEELSDFDEVLIDYGVPKKALLDGDSKTIKQILDKKVRTAEAKYELFQQLEDVITAEEISGDFTDYVQTMTPAGFTASFENMQQLDPKQMAIIQCVVRKNAKIEHVPEEQEVRVSPEDVAIIRYLQPKRF